MAAVLGAGARDEHSHLSRTAGYGFSFCSWDGVHHRALGTLRAALIPCGLYGIVACKPLAEPQHSLVAIQPSLHWSRIRRRNGVAFQLRRVLHLVVWEQVECQSNHAGCDRPYFPAPAD